MHYTRRFLFVNASGACFLLPAFLLPKKCYTHAIMLLRKPLLLLLPSLLLCASRASAAPPPALLVVPNAGTVIVGSALARWQFAPRPLSDETPLTHTFLLRNSAKTPLTIERVAVSCDCVQFQIGESRSLPVQIAPGQTVPVQVTLTSRRLVPGPVSRSAWLYLRGGNNSLQLEMRGIVRDELPASR